MAVLNLQVGGWFQISIKVTDFLLPRIGLAALGVYCLLSRHADKDKKSHPSVRKMARKLTLGKSTVLRALGILVEAKMIQVLKVKGKTSDYVLLNIDAGPPSPAAPQLPLDNNGEMGKKGNKSGVTTGTPTVPVVTPHRTCGDTTHDVQQERIKKTHHPHPREGGGGGGAAAPDHPTLVFLRERVRAQIVLDRIAANASPDLLDAALAHWKAISDGKAKYDIGLLVRFCEKPEAYGFTHDGTRWRRPSTLATDPREIERQRASRETQRRLDRCEAERTRTAEENAAAATVSLVGAEWSRFKTQVLGVEKLSDDMPPEFRRRLEEERLRTERRPGA